MCRFRLYLHDYDFLPAKWNSLRSLQVSKTTYKELKGKKGMKRKQEAAHDEKIVKISSFPALATFSLGGGRERGRCDVRQSRHGTPHTDRQTDARYTPADFNPRTEREFSVASHQFSCCSTIPPSPYLLSSWISATAEREFSVPSLQLSCCSVPLFPVSMLCSWINT